MVAELLRRFLNLPPAGSQLAKEVDSLHFFVILTTFVGAIIAGLVTLYFLWRYRARGEQATTRHVRVPRAIEYCVAGSIVALFVSWWVLGFRQYMTMQISPPNTYDVYVTGKQWMWKFSYPDGKSSVSVLVVPSQRPVRLVLTSRDVVHSFFVPALRLKADALPGRYTSLWFETTSSGTYPVYCAEYCGLSHSRMKASLVALSERDFRAWQGKQSVEQVARATQGLAREGLNASEGEPRVGLASQGELYAQNHGCFSCHAAPGRDPTVLTGEPAIAPGWVGLYGSKRMLVNGDRVVANEQYLRRSMTEPQRDVVAGYALTMPTYKGQIDPDEEIAIIAYIRSLSRLDAL